MSWDRFTEKARVAIYAADDEAARRGRNEIATEHLLLGLLREQEGVAGRLLRQNCLTPHKVRVAWSALRQEQE